MHDVTYIPFLLFQDPYRLGEVSGLGMKNLEL
jgi:hypothetical protein